MEALDINRNGKLIMLGKKIKYLCSFLLFLFISLFLYGENYKIFEINRSEDCYNLINNELSEDYDIQNYFAISSTEKGVHFKQYFYKIDDEYICLGIKAFNGIQEKAICYINAEKEIGTKCIVYLSRPTEKQVFYLWEPTSDSMNDLKKELITIKTTQGTYQIMIKKGVKELELKVGGMPELISIKGLDKFPDLKKINYVGFKHKK